MIKLIPLLVLVTACSANVDPEPAPDAGSDAGVTPVYCKVDSECPDGQTCRWEAISQYNPNVPGGFSGECVPKA